MLNKEWKLSQYSTKIKTAPELRIFHPTLRLRMLEDDLILTNYPPLTAKTLEESCEYSGPSPSSTKSRPLQPQQHGHHHHAKAIEMDRKCDEKRARQPLPHNPSLDTTGEAKTRATQEHLALNIEGELKTLYHTWGPFRR